MSDRPVHVFETTPLARTTIEAIAGRFGFTYEAVVGKSRKTTVSFVRHVCFWWLYNKCSVPYTMEQIGDMFHRDHTTVLYGIQKVNTQLELPDSAIAPLRDAVRKMMA